MGTEAKGSGFIEGLPHKIKQKLTIKSVEENFLENERFIENSDKNSKVKSGLSTFSFFSQIIPTPQSQLGIGLTIAGVSAATILVFATLSFLQLPTFGLTLPLLICAIGIAGLIIASASEWREEPTFTPH